MINKKGAIPIVSVLIAVALVGVFFVSPSSFSLAQITGSGQYIERPVFKYLKCEPASSLKDSAVVNLEKDGEWLIQPSYTNQYSARLIAPNDVSPGITTPMHFEYSVCNSRVESESNCDPYRAKSQILRTGDEFTIPNIAPNKVVYASVKRSTLFGLKGVEGEYQLKFVPYGLREYNFLSGGPGGFINPNSCSVPSGDDSFRDRILSTDTTKVKSEQSYQNRKSERILQPEEVRWFVTGHLTSASPSFTLDYRGQEAWCKAEGNSATIYKINEVNTGSGSYKIASVEWSDQLGTETCCPGDKRPGQTCNDDFRWEDTQGTQCSVFRPCDGGSWTPINPQTIGKYECVQGSCVLETEKVQCANDLDCSALNQICDKSKWECVDPDVNLRGQKLDVAPDNFVECEAKGGTWIKETEDKRNAVVKFLNIGNADPVVTEYCELNSGFKFPVGTIAFIIIAGVFVIFAVRFRGSLSSGLKTIRGFLRI